MSRTLALFVAALIFPSVAYGQPLTPLTTASGVGGFGGGIRPNTPALTAPMMNPRFRPGFGTGGGFVSPYRHGIGYPFSGVWLGGYGFGYPYYVPAPAPVPVLVPTAPEPPSRPPIILSNEFPAVLVLEFPAPAMVWVNGEKQSGDPATVWTLTSPVLKAGGEYTFEVKARWQSAGKAFEYNRSITVAGGKRSKALVVAGTQVKE